MMKMREMIIMGGKKKRSDEEGDGTQAEKQLFNQHRGDQAPQSFVL